jgi:hypothetical protein
MTSDDVAVSRASPCGEPGGSGSVWPCPQARCPRAQPVPSGSSNIARRRKSILVGGVGSRTPRSLSSRWICSMSSQVKTRAIAEDGRDLAPRLAGRARARHEERRSLRGSDLDQRASSP